MSYAYWVENEQLLVANEQSGKIVWEGMPDGEASLKAVPIPGAEDCVLLLNFRAYSHHVSYGPSPNLVRCTPGGAVVWRAKVPDPVMPDCYTDVTFTNYGLFAYSASGYNVRLDPGTGAILTKTFTK